MFLHKISVNFKIFFLISEFNFLLIQKNIFKIPSIYSLIIFFCDEYSLGICKYP